MTSPLGEARDAFNNYTYLAKELEGAIFSSEENKKKFNEYAAAATVGAAQATARDAGLAAEVVASEQAQHRMLLNAVGLDISDPASLLNKELQREADARTQRETLDREIVELESVNFFQNPLQFMMIQPQLQQKISQYNGLARQENRAGSEIARMQSLATTIKSVTPAKTADLLRQRAAASGEAVVKTAEAAAAQLNAQNAAGHAKQLLDAFTLRRNIFSDVLEMSQLEESINDRRARQADANFWRSIKMEEQKELNDAKKEAMQKNAAIVTGINLYRKSIAGQAAGDLTLEDLKRMPQEQREMWFDVVLRGNFGNTYAQSVPFIERFGNMADAAQSGNAAMMAQLRAVRESARALVPEIKNKYMAANAGKVLKDDDALIAAYEELYARDRQAAAKGADKSSLSPASPYSLDWDALAVQAAAAKNPGLISSILVQAKARNPGANLTAAMTARGLFQEVQANVVSGKVDPKTAAEELARFMALTTASNYTDSGLRYLGLPQLVDYTITPGSTGNQRVDLMNPTQVEAYLTAEIAKQRRVQSKSFLDRGIMHWTEQGYKK